MSPTSSRPLRVMLATVGSRGDVQPMLALAQEFAARGHTAVFAAPPNFEWWVRSQGFEFLPMGMDVQAFLSANASVLTGNPFTGMRAIKRYFAGEIAQWATQLDHAAKGADVLVWAGLAVVAPSVAEHLKLPSLGVLFASCMIPSGMHPPPTIPRHGMPRWVNLFLWSVYRFMAQRVIGEPVNAARVRMGLAPVLLHEHVWERERFVLAFDQQLFPADPAWPAERLAYANYLFFDDPAPLDPQLQAWLADGEPPVFVGFGSMSGEATARMDRIIVDAVSATGRRCLLGAGWAQLGGQSPLPKGWRSVRDAPHAALFPQVAAVVHHGGSGTTAQALRAGAPQVILPLILDQYHHAHRLFLAGLIPRPIPMERVTARALADAINTALALPPAKREAVARRLQASDGRAQLAARVEAMCELRGRQTAPVTTAPFAPVDQPSRA
jgi:vancomycin aglycone glucosyltransferase